jgi:hypothetical protein
LLAGNDTDCHFPSICPVITDALLIDIVGYCIGPYCVSGEIDVNISGYDDYSYQVYYNFSAPYEQKYCVYGNSVDPYDCTLTLDDVTVAY